MIVVARSVLLSASPETVWAAVLRADTFLYVVRGLLGIRNLSAGQDLTAEGSGFTIRMFFFHIIPAPWKHRILIERVDDQVRELQSRESGGLIKRWDHLISVASASDGRTLYTDRIEIEAGIFTRPTVWFAKILFAYRQRRWRKLALMLTKN